MDRKDQECEAAGGWAEAVVDRIVDGQTAVLLIGPDEVEILVPLDDLPARAREGDWLRVQVQEGRLLAAEPDPAATARAARRIRDKLEHLRRRGSPPAQGAD